MLVLSPNNPLITTLYKALDEIDDKWRSYNGVVVPGSWPGQDDEQFIKDIIPKIKATKDSGIPFLGLCLGLQALGVAEGGELVKMPENRQGIYKVKGWWGETYESHWHRFKVIGIFPEYDVYETEGIIEAMRLKNHPFFVGLQFHPEFQSSKEKSHPILKEFLFVCKTYC